MLSFPTQLGGANYLTINKYLYLLLITHDSQIQCLILLIMPVHKSVTNMHRFSVDFKLLCSNCWDSLHDPRLWGIDEDWINLNTGVKYTWYASILKVWFSTDLYKSLVIKTRTVEDFVNVGKWINTLIYWFAKNKIDMFDLVSMSLWCLHTSRLK